MNTERLSRGARMKAVVASAALSHCLLCPCGTLSNTFPVRINISGGSPVNVDVPS